MAQRILLIDDDPLLLTTLGEAFRAAGFEVATAEDGISGIQKAQTRLPDIIVMDFQMPGGSGDQVFLRLRMLKDTAKIPILFISGIPEEAAKKKIPSGFKTAYLRKPCQVEALLDAIRAFWDSPVPSPKPTRSEPRLVTASSFQQALFRARSPIWYHQSLSWDHQA